MPNYLKMPKKQQILALLALGWSYRRIEAETGVRRETISRTTRAPGKCGQNVPRLRPSATHGSARGHGAADESKAAKTFAGSESNAAKTFPGSAARPRFTATVYREAITEKLDAGLSVQRIWQDLVEEYGYGASYESVKRFVRTIAPTRRAVGVFHCAPGAEAQVDFFRGAPTLDAADRRMASAVGVSHDARPLAPRLRRGRVGSEARHVPAAARARLPRLRRRPARHPPRQSQSRRRARLLLRSRQPRRLCRVRRALGLHAAADAAAPPQENGKQERSGGYVKSNALKGRRFDSLDAHNAFLRHWNRTIARLRIHGTTRRQVWTHFVEVEQRGAAAARRRRVSVLHEPASGPSTPMGTSKSPARFYPVPLALLGQRLRVRWDTHLVRVFHADTLVAVHARVAGGPVCAARRRGRGLDAPAGLCRSARRPVCARRPRAPAVGRRRAGHARRPRDSPDSRRAQPDATASARARPSAPSPKRTPISTFGIRPFASSSSGRRRARRRRLATDDPAIRPMTQYTLEDFLR